MVTNELGMGIVPSNRLSRLYRDLVGKANQQVVSEADEVYFLVSGIPMKLKG
jgi:adenosylcobinamide kinase/adenosylcobinamide-phosphate guanylyltransferase